MVGIILLLKAFAEHRQILGVVERFKTSFPNEDERKVVVRWAVTRQNWKLTSLVKDSKLRDSQFARTPSEFYNWARRLIHSHSLLLCLKVDKSLPDVCILRTVIQRSVFVTQRE